jgi:hypothetical protein
MKGMFTDWMVEKFPGKRHTAFGTLPLAQPYIKCISARPLNGYPSIL